LGDVYVCHCRAVTDHVIKDEVSRGASSIDDLAARCGAGSRCGGCWPALEALLHAASRELADALG
jgi:bacterioferritin-associated ferredoxin